MFFLYGGKRIFNINTIVLIFLLIPIIDVATGFFSLILGLYSGYNMIAKMITLLPGIIIRLILLIIVLKELVKYKEYYFYIVFILFLFLFMIEIISFYEHINISALFYGIIYIYKMIFIFIILFYLLYIRNKEIIKRFNLIIFNVVIWYSFAIIFGHLIGIEYFTYGGLGSSGFLIKGSANSASLAFLIASPFILSKLYYSSNKKEKRWLWILYISCIYASFLLLTKVAVLSLIVMLFLYNYYKIKKANIIKKLFLLIFFFIFLFFSINFLEDLNFLKRIIFIYNYADGNILKIVMSGRDEFITNGMKMYINDFTMFQQLFGVGANKVRVLMEHYSGINQGIEVDFGDIITKYGLIGFFLYYSIFIYIFFISIKYIIFSKNIQKKLFSFAYILMFIISNIAGHVFVSGLMGFLIPFLILGIISKRRF